MSCNGCFKNFSAFRKELGCPNCGFSFCSKCLSRVKVPVPKQGNVRYSVCAKCFHALTVDDDKKRSLKDGGHHQAIPADPKPSHRKEDLLPPSMRQHYATGATKIPVNVNFPDPALPGHSSSSSGEDLLPPSMRQHYAVGATRIEVGPVQPAAKHGGLTH